MAAPNTRSEVQIMLPVHDPASALVLARELLEVADAKKLSSFLTRSREHMRTAAAELTHAVGAHGHAAMVSIVHDLDTEIDRACAAMSSILTAWGGLPDDHFSQAPAARSLAGALFPDGLRALVQSEAAVEAEMLSARLTRVRRSPELRHDLSITGLEPLASYLDARVGPYGDAARATRAALGTPTGPDLRPPYLALLDAMRAFVARVNAQIEPGDANSARRAKRLLAPLVRARRAARHAPHAKPGAPPASGATGGTPSTSVTGTA